MHTYQYQCCRLEKKSNKNKFSRENHSCLQFNKIKRLTWNIYSFVNAIQFQIALDTFAIINKDVEF